MDITAFPRPRPAGRPSQRALVLAGGGAAGNAWELGLVAGLAESGVDVLEADLIVGTSAGSTVAAQITSGTAPSDLYAAILAEPPRPPSGRGPADKPGDGSAGSADGPRGGGHSDTPRRGGLTGPGYVQWSDGVIAASSDVIDLRRRMGAAALELDPDGSGQSRWRDVVAARLPSRHWPDQDLLVTAVDAGTGEPVLFDRDSGIDLVDAVAASTGNGYPIGERRYLNGGYRRSENADLAAGYGRVLVLSPFSGRTRMPLEWRMDLASQVDDLRASGSRVETIFPDAGAGEVFDANALDPATRLPAARGGHAQGQALAQRLRDFWT
jgi:NTE family protein